MSLKTSSGSWFCFGFFFPSICQCSCSGSSWKCLLSFQKHSLYMPVLSADPIRGNLSVSYLVREIDGMFVMLLLVCDQSASTFNTLLSALVPANLRTGCVFLCLLKEHWVQKSSCHCRVPLSLYSYCHIAVSHVAHSGLSPLICLAICICYHQRSHCGVVSGWQEPKHLPCGKKMLASTNWRRVHAKLLFLLKFKTESWQSWLLQPTGFTAACALSASHAIDQNMTQPWQPASKHSSAGL